MSPGALNRFSINTPPVKHLKPNYKILSPSNYFIVKQSTMFADVDLNRSCNKLPLLTADLSTHT